MSEKKVVEIIAPEDHRYGHITSRRWQAGYSVLFDTPYVKYISIDFGVGNDADVVVSKIVHPFGVRYYVAVPGKTSATSMLVSLTDTSHTIFNLLHEHSVSFMCKKGTEFAEVCYQTIKLLQVEEALTIAEVLRDLGDF